MMGFNGFVVTLCLVVVASAAEDCQYCTPEKSCWPTLQEISDLNITLDGDIITAENSLYKYVLLL